MRSKRTGCNLDSMRQFACLVIGQIMSSGFADDKHTEIIVAFESTSRYFDNRLVILTFLSSNVIRTAPPKSLGN